MLRVSEYIGKALGNEPYRNFKGIILIWNLTNRCNLHCKHCYSGATPLEHEELSLEEVSMLIPQLAQEGVRFAILSGGEPLLREDIFEIARLLKDRGIKTYLSTNGTLIGRDNLSLIKEHFDYVGISLDGSPEVHAEFRGSEGAFKKSLKAIEMCLEEGINVGVRFTLSADTVGGLQFLLGLSESMGIPKLYVSHLVYAGRGTKLLSLGKSSYREVMESLIDKAFELYEKGGAPKIVTGNNEADAVLLYEMFGKRYPERREKMYEILRAWGGNQAGVRLVNINHRGDVRPDPFFPYIIGNVKEKSFGDIWNSNGILSKLREHPRKVKGKCATCKFLEICNGNSRARAYAYSGDYFGEDPACYMS